MITFGFTLVTGTSGGGVPNLTSPFSGLAVPSIAFSELATDPTTGDLAFPPYIVRGPDAVVQKIRQRFKFFKGEWFLDQRLGVPYLQSIFIKAPNQIFIDAVFSSVLLGTPGVASIASFSSSLDRLSRTLTVDFQVTLVDGTTVTAQAEPFILG